MKPWWPHIKQIKKHIEAQYTINLMLKNEIEKINLKKKNIKTRFNLI